MSNPEMPKARAYIIGAIKLYQGEKPWETGITGAYPVARVGVITSNGETPYDKIVTPFFTGLRAFTGEVVRKPFYGKRVRHAQNKAERIAQRLNK
jgi:hypothetical protein